jgi:methionine-rich copper-binding protein CopC
MFGHSSLWSNYEGKKIMNRHHRLVSVAVVAASLAFVLVAALAAHMKLVKSMPVADATSTAPPSRIQVWFSQAPDVKVSKLDLAGPTGAVKLTNFHAMDDKSIVATVADKMSDGLYTVAWQAAGDDGHVQKGAFKFTLKRVAE